MDLPARKKLPHNIPQWVTEGSWYFITIKCVPPGKNQLCQADVGDSVLAAIAHNHDKLIWHCRLCLLMPDHLHAIIAFPREPGMQTVISNWKKFVAVKLGVKWQRDFFDHRLRDHHELEEKTGYILMNPVRKGLCERLEDWIWVYRPANRSPPQLGQVGRVTPCAPFLACVRAAGRGLPALPQTALANFRQTAYPKSMNRKPSIFRLAVVMLVVLAWSSLAFCDEIHQAVWNGDLAKVKALLEAHPDLVNSKDTNGITPLDFAANNSNKDMVEFLLANKAEVMARDKYGQTPLHSAARLGHKDVAELLLANKADINAKDTFGDTPLQGAAYHGYKDVAELLLANQADVHSTNNQGETPLHLAAMKGHKDVAELLLANKADVNARDTFGGTPLHAAAGSGYEDVVELLLASKADVNARNNDGWTPLHEAAMSGQKDVAEMLLANNADVNARNNKGETPLHMVLAQATDSRYRPETELGKRNKDMVELLVASNADVNAKDNNGSTPLDYPASNFRDFANLLRQHGATNNFH